MSVGDIKQIEIKTRSDLDIHVRVLSAVEELELRSRLVGEQDVAKNLAAQLTSYTCDADGKPHFVSIDAALAFMATVRGSVVAKIVRAATEFNRLSDESLEEAEKN